MKELTVPALYTVNSTQPDSRQIEITVNLLFEGACFGKYLFSLEAINAAAPDIQNISIADEEGACGVGVIPESAGSRWTKLLVGGKWRNYLQVDALLWTKMQDKLIFKISNSLHSDNVKIKKQSFGNPEQMAFYLKSFLWFVHACEVNYNAAYEHPLPENRITVIYKSVN